MKTNTLIKIAAATLLLTGSLNAQAADEAMSGRVVSGVGSWIAAQGNAALREIGDDLKQDLVQTLKPFIPAPSESDTATKPGDRAAGA